MAKKKNNHLIKKQIINIRTNNPKTVKEVQERILKLYKFKIAPRLDIFLSRLVPADVFITLDSLKINLDNISLNGLESNFAKEVEKKIRIAVIAELQKKGINIKNNKIATGGSENKQQRVVSKREILQTFISEGRYPSWASGENPNAQVIMAELLEENPKTVQAMLVKLAKRPEIQKRLFMQFDSEIVDKMIAILYGSDYKQVKAQLLFIQKRIQRQYPASSRKRVEKLVQEAALDFYVKNTTRARKFRYKEREFNLAIIEKVQEGYQSIADVSQIDYKTKVKPAFAQSYQDLDILEYFLQYGSVPAWADVGTKLNLQEIYNELSGRNLAALQRMIERNIGQESFVQRLIMQFSDMQIINLLEPISSETVNFIQQTIAALSLFERSRPNVSRSISASKSQEIVLKTALEYAFLRKKTNFVKQTFLQDALENLAPALNSNEDILLDELIAEQQTRRENKTQNWGDELETVLETLQNKRETTQTRKETQLNEALETATEIETQLKELSDILNVPELPPSQRAEILKEIEKLQTQLNTLERKQISTLSELSAPLAQRLNLEWQNLQNLIANLQTQTEELIETPPADSPQIQLITAQNELETQLRARLKELLANIEKTLSQPKTIERSLKLQRLNKELIFVLNFFQNKQKTLSTQLDSWDKQLKQASNSRQKQLIRAQRDSINAQINALKEEIAELTPQQNSLQKTINELTRITMKEGESLDTADNDSSSTNGSSGTRSRMDYLLFFLEYAALPWWAEAYKNDKIEDIFAELSRSEPQNLRRNLSRLGRNPAVWKRLVAQLSETTLQALVDNLYPAQAKMVAQQLFILERILTSQVLKNIQDVAPKEFKWAKIIETLLTRDNLSLQGFVQHVVKIMALDYNLSPAVLLQIVKNLDKNIPDAQLTDFADTAQQLDTDEELSAIELDLNRQEARRRLVKAGVELSDVDKLTIIQQFIANTKLSQEALDAGINSTDKWEKLLYEQLDLNPQATTGVLFELLKNAQNRSFVVRTLSENAYWELIQNLSSPTLLLAQSYFQTLSLALKDKDLYSEKQYIISFAMEYINKSVDAKTFAEYLIDTTARDNGRNKIAIANEWKRKVSALPPAQRNNSLLPQLLQIEIEALQRNENMPEISQQLQSLRGELDRLSSALNFTQQREALELTGVPQEAVTLDQLYATLDKVKAEYDKVTAELATFDPSAAPVEFLNLQTQQTQLLARVKLLQRKEPARLRNLRRLYQQANAEINENQRQQTELKTAIDTQTELLTAELKTAVEAPVLGINLLELELLAQKAALFSALQQINTDAEEPNPSELVELETVLKQIIAQNKDTSNPDWEEIAATAQALVQKNDNPALAKLLDIIPEPLRQAPNLPAMGLKISQQLQNLLAHSPQLLAIVEDLQIIQDNLYKNIPKTDVLKLIADWQDAQRLQEQLMKGVERDKTVNNSDAVLDVLIALDKLQADIRAKIARESRRRSFAPLVQIENRLRLYSRQTRQLRDLEQIQPFADNMEAAQVDILAELEAYYNENPSPELAAELPAMRRNISRQLAQIQQGLIWQKRRLLQTAQAAAGEKIRAAQELQQALEDEQKDILAADKPQSEEEIARAQAEEEAVKKQREARRKMIAPKPIDEPLLVKNAGLVILSPFIPRYFDALGLVKNKFFVSIEAQYKAIHLLQYLATKQLETPENELVFNKVLVGLPINTPVPLSVEISQEEIDFSESLIQGAIANWARMKTMSPDALRSTFIARTGTIKEEADRWKLTVEKNSFDMLLRTISWGFTFLRYSWLEKSVFVEWNYM